MTPFFLDLRMPSDSELGTFLACLGALLVVALGVKMLFFRHPPIEAEFVSKAEFQAAQAQNKAAQEAFKVEVNGSIAKLGDKLDNMAAEIVDSYRRDNKGIHERVNTIAETVARIDERTKRTST